MNTRPIAVLALIVIFAGSQFLEDELYLYLVLATLALLIFTIAMKINLERKQSDFSVAKYIPGLIGVVFSIGNFFYYYLIV